MIVLYIDPGTGSMLISAVIALFSVAFFMLKGVIYRKFSLGGDKGEILDPNKKYGLVFYSEGKQYWNVFKPLIEECSKRSIPVTYLTSDKEDPALNSNYEDVETIFIGTGREAYFNLNRINATMVVMTTPGLDVLEIRRSKNVLHYSHVTHATSSSGSYKSYATDYYDSVLVGGDGEVSLIRELERKRNLPEKRIEIIGHTYLDVLREKLRTNSYDYHFFKERRPTVLVSPTWGNHGLLTKYGKEILKRLEENDAYNVIVRPHPQSFISEAPLMEELMKEFPNNDLRVWNTDAENLEAMAHADIMISDFSGIIFDFYTLFKRPILTMNAQYEKRGREAMDLDDDPWDIKMLDEIGRTIYDQDIPNLTQIIEETLVHHTDTEELETLHIMDKCPGESAVRGVNFIESTLKKLEVEAASSNGIATDAIPLSQTYTLDGQHKGSWFKRLFTGLFNPNMLLQIMLSLGMLFSYAYIATKVLPRPNEGLNQIFLLRVLPYIFVAMILSLVVLILSLWLQGKGTIMFMKKSESVSIADFFLIAFPMTPIIQYIFANQDILSFSDSLVVFGYFSVITLVCVVVIPWILSPLMTKSLTVASAMAILFIVFNMASFGKTTPLRTIALILLVIYGVVFFVLYFNKQKLLVTISLIFFVTNATVSMFKPSDNGGQPERTELNVEGIDPEIANLTAKRRPDIFLLIYDSYVNQETMDAYGYDNSDQINYLIDNGFAIYDGTYSIGANSLTSMSHVLNPSRHGPDQPEYRSMISGNASVLQLLQKNGYLTHSVLDSDYYTKGFDSQYYYSFPSGVHSINASKIIINAVLEGEFRFNTDFSEITYDDLFAAKTRILTQNLEKPEFLYHHNPNPSHSQNSGVLLPNETELHLEKLEFINEEMKKDIDNIRSKSRDAIIIIAGDHGPYLTKNGIGLYDYDTSEIDRLDIQDRYGSFLAISWPEDEYQTRYDIKILQDIFPAVLSYMFDDDSVFDALRTDREIMVTDTIGGANVIDGIIYGGINDGEPLFEVTGVRFKEQ